MTGFLQMLTKVGERIALDGLSLDDVAVAVGIAELFPGVFCAVYDADGRYLWASSSLPQLLGGDATSMLGRRISEFFGPAWSEERLGLVERVLRTGEVLPTVEIFRGRRLEGAVLSAARASPRPMAVFVGRFGLALTLPGGARPAVTPVLCEHADWGPLAPLTRRELEVLRLIAKGLDNAGIARAIHRSKRAVEWHIKNLYSHLRSEQRTDLYRFGLEAGLADIDDAHWERVVAHVHVGHEANHGPDAD